MKVISYIVVAVLSFGLAIFLSGSFGEKSEPYDFSAIDNSVEIKESTEFTTYYDQLTDYQKTIYDALLGPVSKAQEKITFTNVNIADFSKNCLQACVALQYDHPEYFWFECGYTMYSRRPSFEELGEVEIEPAYYQYVSTLFNAENKLETLQQEVEKVADLARNHSSDDYERIIFVHDYLIENAYYDTEALNEYYISSHNPSCEYIFSAYGCLVEGKTVCSGYAKAFQLVLNELGYDCTYVTGDAGERHGWNCVYLEGEGYYVDVTWDDRDFDKEVPMYDYALINDEALNRTHQVDMEFDSPVCNATDYNYFIKRGYYTETYDFDEVSRILSEQSNNDAAHVRFGSLDELGKAYDELIRRKKVFKINGMDEFLYSEYNEDIYTLTVLK